MFTISLIVLQLLIFGGLIFFFRKIMTQNVSVATRHLDDMAHDYAHKEQEVNKSMQEAKVKAAEIISRAQEEVDALKKEASAQIASEKDTQIQQARRQAVEIIEQADKSRQLLLSEIDSRISKGALAKACELIQSALPEDLKISVHKKWVADIAVHGFQELSNLHIAEGIKDITVKSAYPLDSEEKQKILEKLKAYVGGDVSFNEEVDRKVVAGVVIYIGSIVLDASLQNKIQEKARE